MARYASCAWLLCLYCAAQIAVPILYFDQVDNAHGGAAHRGIEAMNLMLTYQRWRQYQRTRNALRELGDRELADLGIERDKIDELARRAL